MNRIKNWFIRKLGGKPLNIPKEYTEKVEHSDGIYYYPKGFWD
ncbi:MAG: hypothetical protein AABY22_21345 [Nanoarchaeota archaeon]